MIDLHTLEKQLKRAGCNFRFWGRSELRELQHIIMPGETITCGVNGHYAGGFALICVTDRRLLLVDRKPLYLALEDIRFDMIAEVDYSYRLMNATMRVFTPNKSLVFTSANQHKLRQAATYVQQRVMEIRQYYLGQQFQQDQQQPQISQSPPAFAPPNLALQTNTTTIQKAGRLGIRGIRPPMHNPYAQIPLTSRHWTGRGWRK